MLATQRDAVLALPDRAKPDDQGSDVTDSTVLNYSWVRLLRDRCDRCTGDVEDAVG